MKWYVDGSAKCGGNGSESKPFIKINQAASIARRGDEIIVAPGIYREDVNPLNAGTEKKRITYISKEHRKAVITGADEFKNWENHSGNVWKLTVSNSYFGSYPVG